MWFLTERHNYAPCYYWISTFLSHNHNQIIQSTSKSAWNWFPLFVLGFFLLFHQLQVLSQILFFFRIACLQGVFWDIHDHVAKDCWSPFVKTSKYKLLRNKDREQVCVFAGYFEKIHLFQVLFFNISFKRTHIFNSF